MSPGSCSCGSPDGVGAVVAAPPGAAGVAEQLVEREDGLAEVGVAGGGHAAPSIESPLTRQTPTGRDSDGAEPSEPSEPSGGGWCPSSGEVRPSDGCPDGWRLFGRTVRGPVGRSDEPSAARSAGRSNRPRNRPVV